VSVRLAVLSDVHGNPVALDACLARLGHRGVDECFFLGDAVGYLPGERECLERLEAAGIQCQLGNHEAMLLGTLDLDPAADAVYGLAAARARLPNDDRARLETWPESRQVERDGRRILFVHGSPDDALGGYVYPDTDLAGWERLPHDAVFMGHTHRPFVARRGPVLIVNAGSVGLPRDVGNLASFAVYDTATGTATCYRVEFDADAAIRGAGTDLHPATRACFARRSPQFVGEVLA
jgi:predicted phosphodiesterase